jgi:hypothetical protein
MARLSWLAANNEEHSIPYSSVKSPSFENNTITLRSVSKKFKVITCLFGPALVLRMAILLAGPTVVSSATPTAAKE